MYVDIRQSIYGLPKAGVLTNKVPKESLAPHGYFEVTHTPGLWQHITRPILFDLVVDDFGGKYIDKAYADHLIAALKNTIKYLKTGLVDYTAAPHYSGTTT